MAMGRFFLWIWALIALAGCNHHAGTLDKPPQAVEVPMTFPEAQRSGRHSIRRDRMVSTVLASDRLDPEDAHCRQIKAEAGARAAVLASPHLVGEVSQDVQVRRSAAGAGFEVADYAKASLVRSKAALECEAYTLEQSLRTAERNLNVRFAAAGLRARHKFLTSAEEELHQIEGDIAAALDRGNINLMEASSLREAVSALRALRHSAEADAARLSYLAPEQRLQGATVSRIAQVQASLADVERRLRQAEAWRVSLEGGLENVDRTDLLAGSHPQSGWGAYGKIRATYKVGDLVSGSYEREAKNARIDAVYHDHWNSRGKLQRAQDAAAAYASVSDRRVQILAQAVVEGQSTVETLRRAGGDRDTNAGLAARLGAIRAQAELAESKAALVQAKRDARPIYSR